MKLSKSDISCLLLAAALVGATASKYPPDSDECVELMIIRDALEDVVLEAGVNRIGKKAIQGGENSDRFLDNPNISGC